MLFRSTKALTLLPIQAMAVSLTEAMILLPTQALRLWTIGMTSTLEHCDDKGMEHCDYRAMEHCNDKGMENCDDKWHRAL